MSVNMMKKLTAIAFYGDLTEIVRSLLRLRCVELMDMSASGESPAPRVLEQCDLQTQETAQRLEAIREAMPCLALYGGRKKRKYKNKARVDRNAFIADGRDARAWRAVEKTVALHRAIQSLNEEQPRLEKLIVDLDPWLAYNAPLDAVGSKRTVLITGAFPVKTDVEALEREFNSMGACMETVSREASGVYVTLSGLCENEEAMIRLAVEKGFVKIELPAIPTTARIAAEQAETRLGDIKVELFKAEEDLHDLSEYLNDIEVLYDIEQTNAQVAEQLKKSSSTRSCGVLCAWVPAQMEETVAGALSELPCAFEIVDPEWDDLPPIMRGERLTKHQKKNRVKPGVFTPLLPSEEFTEDARSKKEAD